MLHHLDQTGLTVGEAALHLGISPTAVRRRIQRGTLRAWKVDGAWRVDGAAEDDRDRPVHVPVQGDRSIPPCSPEDVPPVYTAVSPVEAVLRDEVADLRHRLDQAEAEREAKDRQIAELHVLLQRALEQRAPLVLPAAEPEPVSRGDTPMRKRRWWQWLT